jgi:hypothetical protein
LDLRLFSEENSRFGEFRLYLSLEFHVAGKLFRACSNWECASAKA